MATYTLPLTIQIQIEEPIPKKNFKKVVKEFYNSVKNPETFNTFIYDVIGEVGSSIHMNHLVLEEVSEPKDVSEPMCEINEDGWQVCTCTLTFSWKANILEEKDLKILEDDITMFFDELFESEIDNSFANLQDMVYDASEGNCVHLVGEPGKLSFTQI